VHFKRNPREPSDLTKRTRYLGLYGKQGLAHLGDAAGERRL
jgi:hypothetical protein